MSYDVRSETLAMAFLEDYESEDDEMTGWRVQRLAQHIQDAIEEWLDAETEDPGFKEKVSL